MAKRWNEKERLKHKLVLQKLYCIQNKSIREIGEKCCVSEKTIYKRLLMLGIQTNRTKKKGYCNQRNDIVIPKVRSTILAEFFGIMLGDGKISPSQVLVTLGNKEKKYATYVQLLMQKLFGVCPKIAIRKQGYIDLYIGSVQVSRWLIKEGLVYNKVQSQVDAPGWIFDDPRYCRAFVKGFFDTDGSIYRLRHGIQMSFTNHSAPLLASLQRMLTVLEYEPSVISSSKVYITQKKQIIRFFKEMHPANPKHVLRFDDFIQDTRVGTQAVNEGRL